jgi:hypothetical protein
VTYQPGDLVVTVAPSHRGGGVFAQCAPAGIDAPGVVLCRVLGPDTPKAEGNWWRVQALHGPWSRASHGLTGTPKWPVGAWSVPEECFRRVTAEEAAYLQARVDSCL